MFGILRYVLALLVVYGHLWPLRSGHWNWAGHYAVFSFYVLSGYLMTLVLQRRYSFSATGLLRFFANRALRIYPPYLAAALLGITVIVTFPDAALRTTTDLRLPVDCKGWLLNLGILWLHKPQPARLVPPAWSLSVELIYYTAMGLALGRSMRVTVVWLAASIAFTAWTVAAGWAFNWRSATPEAASVAFASGSLLYYLPRPAWIVRTIAPLAALYLLNIALAAEVWRSVHIGGFYASLLLGVALVWALSSIDVASAPRWLRRTDTILGDLAYPIFLCHFQMAALVIATIFAGQRPTELRLLLWSLPATHLGAWIIHRAVEHPLAQSRAQLRPTASAGGTQAAARVDRHT